VLTQLDQLRCKSTITAVFGIQISFLLCQDPNFTSQLIFREHLKHASSTTTARKILKSDDVSKVKANNF
jgi:hypothetical protein